MEPVKLLERAATGAAHAVRHPIASAAYAAGVVRGLAGVALHGATVGGHDPGQQPEARQTAQQPQNRDVASGPRLVPRQPAAPEAEDVPQPEPAPGEQFATEPKAVSRKSEHGGPATDEEIDAWIDEAVRRDEVDIETPVGTTGAAPGHNPDTAETDLQQPDTEPLLDPSTAKAIRSESAMLQKDAERDPSD